MNSVKELLKSAKKVENTTEKEKKIVEMTQVVFPAEYGAVKEFQAALAKNDTGLEELDKQFPRIDIPLAMTLMRRAKGVPIPVPRFVTIPLEEAMVCIQASADIRGKDTMYERSPINGGNNDSYGFRSLYLSTAERLVKYIARRDRRWVIIHKVLPMLIFAACVGTLAFFPKENIACALAIVFGVISIVWGLNRLIAFPSRDHRREYAMTLEAALPGLMPDHTRANVRSLMEKKTFDKIFIVGEANWKLTKESTVRRWDPDDPLVVGYKNKAYYLIDVYDPTTVETWLATQFTE